MINLFLSTQFALRLAEEGVAPITTTAFLIALVVVFVLIIFNGFSLRLSLQFWVVALRVWSGWVTRETRRLAAFCKYWKIQTSKMRI